MNKEEILAKSRAENKNKDLYSIDVSKLAGSITMVVMMVIAGVFFVVQIVTGGGLNFGMWALVFSADMTNHWVKYIKLRLRGELLAALLYLLYTLIVAVMSGYHIYNLIASSTIL